MQTALPDVYRLVKFRAALNVQNTQNLRLPKLRGVRVQRRGFHAWNFNDIKI
jgi:hypothetical protein